MDGDQIMIVQMLLDFARDVMVNFLMGIASFWPASSVDGILATIGVPASLVGTVLAVFYQPIGWGIMVALLITYGALFIGSGIIKAIAGRIG